MRCVGSFREDYAHILLAEFMAQVLGFPLNPKPQTGLGRRFHPSSLFQFIGLLQQACRSFVGNRDPRVCSHIPY